MQTQYVAGQNHICILDNTGVKCLGDNSLSQLIVPALSHPTRVFADSVGNQTCASDDSGLVCWGEDQASQSSLGAVSSISAGYGNTCVTIPGKWNAGEPAPRELTRLPRSRTLIRFRSGRILPVPRTSVRP